MSMSFFLLFLRSVLGTCREKIDSAYIFFCLDFKQITTNVVCLINADDNGYLYSITLKILVNSEKKNK